MKLTILTTLTNPDRRQDKWQEALRCYLDLADEVVVVNGGEDIKIDVLHYVIQQGFKEGFEYDLVHNVKWVDLKWPDEWNWIELPRHLNEGLVHCTGDWIIKFDIDQLIHERNFAEIRKVLYECPFSYDAATMQKASFVYNRKYFQKGGHAVCFRNKPYIRFGRDKNKVTDLCFPIYQKGVEVVDDYEMPWGDGLEAYRTGVKYWNYDYFFKTQEFTRKEFWRFSQAYHQYFGTWHFGGSEKDSFERFLQMQKGRYDLAPYEYVLETHPKYMREAVKELKPEQFGYNAWGLL